MAARTKKKQQRAGTKAHQARAKLRTKLGLQDAAKEQQQQDAMAAVAVDHGATVAGLANLGNTCFFNAVTQVPPLPELAGGGGSWAIGCGWNRAGVGLPFRLG